MDYGSPLLPERFWRKVHQDGECWLWTGAGTATSQIVEIGGRRYIPRRLLGLCPFRLYLRPTCGTPGCIRPNHQFLRSYGGTDHGKPIPMEEVRTIQWKKWWERVQSPSILFPQEVIKEISKTYSNEDVEISNKTMNRRLAKLWGAFIEGKFQPSLLDLDGGPMLREEDIRRDRMSWKAALGIRN